MINKLTFLETLSALRRTCSLPTSFELEKQPRIHPKSDNAERLNSVSQEARTFSKEIYFANYNTNSMFAQK